MGLLRTTGHRFHLSFRNTLWPRVVIKMRYWKTWETAGLHGSRISPSVCCLGKFIILQSNKYSAAVLSGSDCKTQNTFLVFSHLHGISLQKKHTKKTKHTHKPGNHIIDPPVRALIKSVFLHKHHAAHTNTVKSGGDDTIMKMSHMSPCFCGLPRMCSANRRIHIPTHIPMAPPLSGSSLITWERDEYIGLNRDDKDQACNFWKSHSGPH